MPDLVEPVVCRFNDFLLIKREGLFRLDPGGGKSPVEIGPTAFRILCLLVDRRGEIVSQREIMHAVWQNVAVEPNNLTTQLTALRRVLDVGRGEGSCIQNIRGRGYRFVPLVTDIDVQSGVPVAAMPAEAGFAAPPARSGGWSRRSVLIAGLCLLAAAALLPVAWHLGRTPTSSGEKLAGTASPAPVARQRLSFVVLPFRNLGGEDLDDATVDALTEDLTSNLSQFGFPISLVIGSGSALTYKGKPIDVRRVGEELGVRYAVEGTVRRIEGTLRVTAQMVSTETGTQLWADGFGIEREGASYNFDSVSRQIGNRLKQRVVEIESARGERERPTNPDAIDLVLQAYYLTWAPPNPQLLSQSIELLERALKLDPSSPLVLSTLAEYLLSSIDPDPVDDPTAPEKISRVEELDKRAMQLSPNNKGVLSTHVFFLFRQNRCPELVPIARRISAQYPTLNSPPNLRDLCLLLDGQAAEAISGLTQWLRTNPRHPAVHMRYRAIGYGNLFLGRYDEAILAFNRSIGSRPNDLAWSRSDTLAGLAAAQALAGHDAEARATAAEATRLRPTITARGYYSYKIGSPVHAEQVARMRDGLRLARIRDHADENTGSGMAPDNILHSEYEAPTPTSAPGARTIRTAELEELIQQRKPLILDVSHPWGNSIPGAIGLWGGGVGGSTSDAVQERMGRVMQLLSHGDKAAPIVTVGWNSERYQGRNLALRLLALGYGEVYWYRGGREAWAAAGLPQSEIALQAW